MLRFSAFSLDTIELDDRVIARHQQARLTYDDLDRKSNALARGLISAGVKKGDRVAISLGNNIEYAIVRVPEGEWNRDDRYDADAREGNLWHFQTRCNPGELHMI